MNESLLRSSCFALTLALALVGLPHAAQALPVPLGDGVSASSAAALPAVALALDGEAYLVGGIEPEFAEPHADHPSLDSVLSAEIVLGRVTDGYVAPREGLPQVTTTLEQIAKDEPAFYYASALATINYGILSELNRKGLGAVLVQTNPADIDPQTGEDKRIPVTQDVVRVEIQTGRIGELRVVEVDGFGFGDVSDAQLERIKARSPIQPAGSDSAS
ncbi:MAG: hypothetical protein JRG82_13820, partial [Deltaproteobacteria bacterium]|nr:hypothetical protein [Deltaproteobacteria bacterium]